MKRPSFLTTWLALMLIFSVGVAIYSLTYLSSIVLTKNYLSLFGIAAGFVQVWAVIQLLRWKKIGVTLYISTAVIIFLVTAVNDFNIAPSVNQAIESLSLVFIVNVVVLGILYLAIRPVWKNFK